MSRRLKAGGIGLAAVILTASMLVIATASGSGSTRHYAKVVGAAGAVAHMSEVRTGVKRALLNHEGTIQPNTSDGAVGVCPKRFPTPVSGWFASKSDKVVLMRSIPIGKKEWAVGVLNLDTVPVDYIVGIVCVK